MTTETMTVGAGCFWGVEWVFRQVPGVIDAVSGYAGGNTPDPTYGDVCSHTTGHAEVVRLTFDPRIVGFEQLLEVFWAMHDPTQVDRQGPDVGDQYRSVIFAENEDQRRIAETSKERAQGSYSREIATTIESKATFYPAEDYHQHYYERTGHQPYCHVLPVATLRELGLLAPASS
jgi:methionine-S-sulfoxide reductase